MRGLKSGRVFKVPKFESYQLSPRYDRKRSKVAPRLKSFSLTELLVVPLRKSWKLSVVKSGIQRSLAEVEREIRDWIGKSKERFKKDFQESIRADEDNMPVYSPTAQKLWVIKCSKPQYLGSFFKNKKQLNLSSLPGMTWGDGVYVTPIQYPYSTIMYGRIGVVGWLDMDKIGDVYDASDPQGIALYQEWIRLRCPHQYTVLTTTVHADMANRYLRNRFRRTFNINLVFFRPDQRNPTYVSPVNDYWFVVADWVNMRPHEVSKAPKFSNQIRECEWVVAIEEEFSPKDTQIYFRDLMGPHMPATLGVVRTANQLPNKQVTAKLLSFYNRIHKNNKPRPFILKVHR